VTCCHCQPLLRFPCSLSAYPPATRSMAISKRALLLSSCALTFFSKKYAPESPFTQGGFVKTALVLFALQYLARAVWSVVVYPFVFSPLRHIPQPPVRAPFFSAA